MSSPHLLVAISAHGYGHFSQVAPVINRLLQRIPGLRLTLRTDLPERLLAGRIEGPFTGQPASDDFGLVMHDAVRVDAEASLQRYRELHAGWQRRLADCAAELEAAAPDLVLADVPYLTLAAAQHAGIPALAMCSLNWFDIARAYLPDTDDSRRILDTMQAAYQGADLFLQPEPSMPMDWLANRRPIGPVASPGTRRRDVLLQQAGIAADEQVILVAMGGMALELDIRDWQPARGQRLLIPPGWPLHHERVHHYTAMGLGFQDLLASSDLVFSKSGYGTFVEAAAAGLPVLHLSRPDWPEAPFLESWLAQRVHQVGIDANRFSLQEAIEASQQLLERGCRAATGVSGVEQAARIIAARLSGAKG